MSILRHFAGCTISLSVVSAQMALPQITLNSIGVNVGMIHAFAAEKYVFYPELEIGGQPAISCFGWSVYVAHWDDAMHGVTVTDNAIYSLSGNILGARISFDPSKVSGNWILPLQVFGGIAHYFISAKYVGGVNYSGGTDYFGPNSGTSLEFGLKSSINLSESFGLRAEGHRLFPIEDRAGRFVYSVGTNYIF
ncbi:MAG TPA: hypothetical protein VLY03_08055 [Bacteroidota bacterium]|nr:hypothetical protein [Bacteroidota bacterium]